MLLFILQWVKQFSLRKIRYNIHTYDLQLFWSFFNDSPIFAPHALGLRFANWILILGR